MARPATWALAGAASVALHAAALGGLALALRPDPTPQQKPPPTEVELASEPVRRSRATEAPAEARPAAGQKADATPIAQDAPRRTAATAEELGATRLSSTAPTAVAPPVTVTDPVTLDAAPASGEQTETLNPDTAITHPIDPDQAAAAQARPQETSLSADLPVSLAASAVLPAPSPAGAVAARPTQAQALSQTAVALAATDAPKSVARIGRAAAQAKTPAPLAQQPQIVRASLSDPGAALATLPAQGTRAPPASAAPTAGRKVAPRSEPVAETPAEDAAPRLTAALAWEVGESNVADPVSLAAIQAFMQPQDPASGESSPVRDGLQSLLAGIPCSRLQTEFVPETGTLELRGHVPEDGMRAPLLAALQAQMGSAIRVADEILILPAPQCGALAGIATVGLPQSDDQRTNPRIVGANAHVREFNYRAGQRLTLELVAPDYDAFVYIDYFDADGNVLHLQPNEIVPLARAPAKATLTSGAERDGAPALDITIGPPFGQEIAAAFATSAPLYDDLRPLIEPAEPYLDFLRERITAARERDPDFKGEWVYFFITTRPAG